MDFERRGYRVTGRVQGVGFRWWTQRRASALGLAGFVLNRSDGSVEVHAGGPADALRDLEFALASGPPMARVDDLERIDARPMDEGDAFRVEHEGRNA